MMTPEGLAALAADLARLNNLPREIADDYAARIGDTPDVAEDGRVIVPGDDGSELARVIMPDDDEEDDDGGLSSFPPVRRRP